ncbi:hypothetical protein JCGZ_10319 [Jatropha curcas]|uniref:GRF-type domain-containing protein n=1 Tax=Jatropha curcas TaxID=180498 RepID=A0A067KLH2_JATCU|nr:hypothetical protein JCGZ_10319 [Jatropha curcas]
MSTYLRGDSSSSNQSMGGATHVTLCRCGQEAVLKTSWTETNPSRRFLGCINYGTPAYCHFLEWIDLVVHHRSRHVIIRLLRKPDRLEKRRRR